VCGTSPPDALDRGGLCGGVPPSATDAVAARETVGVSLASVMVATEAVASTAMFSKLPPGADPMATVSPSPTV